MKPETDVPSIDAHPISSGHRLRVAAGDLIWLLVAILLSLALRIPFFGIPMIPDEGGYAYATKGWMDGTGKLYHDLWISRPQGIFLVYGAIMETLGTGTYAFRFAAWIAIALTTIAVWIFARMWMNPKVANVAAVLFAVLSSSPSLEGFTANAEIFMGLPAAFAALWLLHISRTKWSFWSLVGVGVLAGLATILKPSGVVMLPVAWGFILMIRREEWRVHAKRCGAVFVGVLIVAIPTVINGITLGWHQFLYATVTYRLFQQSSASVGLHHNLWRILAVSFQVWPMIALLAGVLVVAHWETLRRWFGRIPELVTSGNRAMGWEFVRRVQSDVSLGLITPSPSRIANLQRPTDDAGIILRLWVFGCLGGIAMGGDWWSHYLIQIAAPAAIWLGMIATRITLSLRHLRKRVAFIAMVVVLLAIPYRVLADGSTLAMAEDMYSHPGYPAQQDVATYIRDHTTPDDTIYVAFDQAAIYYLADRKAAYRHLYDQELEGIPTSYTDIISIIQSPQRPKYIISTLHPGPFPDYAGLFWQVVSKYYVVEASVDGVPIYRAKSSFDPPIYPK